ncbi:LLM class flavin-dependent oxidoreductase [Paenarthrobacter nitroguajacolicus]|uniref:LLM class flavin-dependent oxidoreductase n=1 Tax=Paenarthrobacter nitroguajacolicus TaxID=211146 RepID=UPI002856F234|nr:LLM class flavin-dependent oxidoreductase [Paenarthrobacter nitroguajacolicus]MDR6637040.1 5,10-methylenetetrahydromethanopterin reductase [Paenarthrobacter nitroguajacolicus]
MKMGLAIIPQAPVEQCLEWARKADTYGFDSLAYTDDMMFKPGYPVAMLAAKETTRIELGITLSNPHTSHPAILASNAAVLDEVSGGRAFFGIGRGHIQEFKRMLGLDPKRSLQAVAESIQFAKRLWRNDETPFNGEIFTGTEAAMLAWTPVRPEIPVLIGGWGPAMARVAGAHADRLLSWGLWHSGYATELRRQISSGAESVDRKTEAAQLEMEPIFAISEDADEAKATARAMLAVSMKLLSPMSDFVVEVDLLNRINAHIALGEFESAGELISDDILNSFTLYGTPHQVIEKIEAMADEANLTHLSFGMPFHQAEIDSYINLLGEKVLPHFLAMR